MGDHAGRNAKHRKNHYVNFNKNKRPKGKTLGPGFKGFFITCNTQEFSALREAYGLLNEYADKIYPKEEKPLNTDKEDIEDDLEQELAELRKPSRILFHQLSTGIKNILFIEAPETIDPGKLVQAILSDISKTRKQKSRFLLRLLPVQGTCKAYPDPIKATASEALNEFLNKNPAYQTEKDKGKEIGYSVQYKARYSNNAMRKEEVFDILNQIVEDKKLNWKVSLKEPEVVLNVDVVSTVCCFGVLPNYSEFKKYNLIEMVKEDTKDDKDAEDKKEDREDNKKEDGDDKVRQFVTKGLINISECIAEPQKN